MIAALLHLVVLGLRSEPTDLRCGSGCAAGNAASGLPILDNPAPSIWDTLPLGSIA